MYFYIKKTKLFVAGAPEHLWWIFGRFGFDLFFRVRLLALIRVQAILIDRNNAFKRFG